MTRQIYFVHYECDGLTRIAEVHAETWEAAVVQVKGKREIKVKSVRCAGKAKQS